MNCTLIPSNVGRTDELSGLSYLLTERFLLTWSNIKKYGTS